nr:immunoglobulin heavy chain junction region [Macaca mulatta]
CARYGSDSDSYFYFDSW